MTLLFLSNDLQDPNVHRGMRLPIEFISFGFIEGKMYKGLRNHSTFVSPPNSTKQWGNKVVYGGLFLCSDFNFYQRILDAYHACSLSSLMRNHVYDIHHRINTYCTPIKFDTIEDLSRLKYREGEPIECQTYIGNQNHPKINNRLHSTFSHRIESGVEIEPFMNLWEVANGRKDCIR